MITYAEIYETLRKEKYSEQLQPIPKRFVKDVADYISEKKKLLSQQGDFFSDEIIKLKKQIENSNVLFEELMLLRKRKILGLVFVASETGVNRRDFENMLDFERELFEELVESIKQADKKLSVKFSEVQDKEEVEKNELVLFREDVEELVGDGGESIGPFAKGEVAHISKSIAEILLSDDKVELMSGD
jgi:DNA replication initiation complex subunit (GINS family)